MKKIIIIFVSIFLFSCAGTGTKSDSYIPELDSGEQISGKIMVLRDTGWTAGAQVISVKLNGQEIGQLRPKQIVVSDSVGGDNELLANYTGINAIGVTGAEVSFQSDGTQNHYFLITQKDNLFGLTVVLSEVSEQTFRNTR